VDFVLNKKSTLQVAIAIFGFAAVAAVAEAGLIGHADHYVSKNTIHDILIFLLKQQLYFEPA
jgi:hypothetical protein